MSFNASINHFGDPAIHADGVRHEGSVSADTHGEAGQRATLGFLPPADDPNRLGVANIKGFSAAAMQAIIELRDRLVHDHGERKRESKLTMADIAAHHAAMRQCEHALTGIESAVKMAVSAVHARKNAGLDS